MFEKNLEAIREKNPELAEKLEKVNLAEITDIVVEEAETNDLVIGYKNVALHSLSDPIREAKVLWNKAISTELKKTDFQIVFGLGLGYLFKRAYVSAGSKIILVEPFLEVLRFVLEHVDLSAELSNNRVYVTDNVKDVLNKLGAEYLQGDMAEFLYLPAYTNLAPAMVEELTGKIVQTMEGKQTDINTIFRLALPWTQNFILNMPYFPQMRPLGYFKGVFGGKTALIVAAGPSLAENIEKIKQNRDKLVVFAVNKTIEYLVENELVPDFVVFADTRSNVLNAGDNDESTKKLLKQSNIIMLPRTDNEVAQFESKQKLLYITETELFKDFVDESNRPGLGIGKSAGSVAIICYFIAKEMGFRNIAFTGLDLAFPENKMYADGQEFATTALGYIQYDFEKMPGLRKNPAYTKDINGNKLLTRDDYLVFIRQFEEILEDEMSLTKIINTSLKGAFIKGMEYTGFDEFIKAIDAKDMNVDELISGVFEKTSEKWNELIKGISPKVFEKYDEFIELYKNSVAIIEEIDATIGYFENDADSSFDKFLELNEKLVKMRDRIMQDVLLKNALQGTFWNYAKNYETTNLRKKEAILSNLNTEKALFEDVRIKAGGLVKSVEIAFEKIKAESVNV